MDEVSLMLSYSNTSYPLRIFSSDIPKQTHMP